tara:strand:+ start:3373 stop:3621 length:249 start_codon:yes stop_codon:yes gene_type:complete
MDCCLNCYHAQAGLESIAGPLEDALVDVRMEPSAEARQELWRWQSLAAGMHRTLAECKIDPADKTGYDSEPQDDGYDMDRHY